MSDPILNSFNDAKIAAMTALQGIQNQIDYLFDAMSKLQNNQSYYQSLIADIDFKMAAHRASMEQLQLTENNALSLPYEDPSSVGSYNALSQAPSNYAEWSVKDMILHILRGTPMGHDVRMILNLMNSVFGVEVPRTTVSPQLSRMKQDGVLELHGDVWRMTDRYRNHVAHHG